MQTRARALTRISQPALELFRREHCCARDDLRVRLRLGVSARHARVLIHDPRMSLIARPAAHKIVCRPVHQSRYGAICGALVEPVELVEDCVEGVRRNIDAKVR
jgi:hypothetical protein